MTSSEELQLISFLHTASSTSLADFVLARANTDAQLRKDLTALLERVCENRALWMLGSLLRTHGQKLARGLPE